MYKSIPCSNKLLQKRWNEKNLELHKSRLANIKPSIDRRAPSTFSHLKNRAKKELSNEVRYAEIERENRILLDKMSEIMQKKPPAIGW